MLALVNLILLVSLPTTEFDTEASVLLVTVDASKSTGPVQLSISDIVLNSAEIPGINATVIANEHENTLPTGSVLISGSAVEDQLLNATNDLSDVDGLGDISYQWFSDAEVLARHPLHIRLLNLKLGRRLR